MEVVLDKKYPVAAGLDAGWAVLSNMHELATCMPGAQITEEIDATHYKGSVRVKVGPAVAAFSGTIEVLTLDPATRTLKMMGKGADKSGSSASMALTAKLVAAEDGNSTLEGHAEVIVNGKFAQFGGRMMTSVSDMILMQFAEVFSQKAQALQGAATSAEGTGAASAAVFAAPIMAKEFNALAFIWALIRKFFADLFSRKS
ncbi:MAG: SRPBCC family protein [Polaromonas sp.]|uniref:CoxG family protein n=1 Tax=Polaromonas sp. TaxID=1869339 RepID=UPI0027350A0D|nr:SRPBCC family protein [Polaromonas sp.]MDP2817956.1 SRPBCC family protein [Polaromonas sp.]